MFAFIIRRRTPHASSDCTEDGDAGVDPERGPTWVQGDDDPATLARALVFPPSTPTHPHTHTPAAESPPSATAPSLPLSPTGSATPGTMKLLSARELIKHVTAEQQDAREPQERARRGGSAAAGERDCTRSAAEPAPCHAGGPTAPQPQTGGGASDAPPSPHLGSPSAAARADLSEEGGGAAGAGGDACDGGGAAAVGVKEEGADEQSCLAVGGGGNVRRKAEYHTPSRPPPPPRREAGLVGTDASQQPHETASLAERGWFDTGYLSRLQR